ncbi:MAG: HEAT repeat domain-containing protein [Ktedonobacteraceae bacterium]|nr:HEAT repeat domain-containing protein [Ktedonobacteraceae bacterium]
MSENVPLTEPEDQEPVQPGYLGPTPPPGQLPPKGERVWVDRKEQLLQAVSVLTTSRVVAVDAEFTQARSHAQGAGRTTVPRLALLQLAIDKSCFVVDALRLQDLSPLIDVVGNPAIVVLLHGAGGDMRVMAERRLNVIHYYDLEAASRSIFGQHESSLASMLQRAFHMRLDKSLQRTDWTRRPLPPAMIAYAARDAEVTLALYHWLDEYYHPILQLHENTDQPDEVAPWIEPFLRGTASLSPEMAVAEARAKGIIKNKAQVAGDCRAALERLTHPMRRSRLLRLIGDLALLSLVPDIIPLLQAATSDERAASARTLGRMDVKSAQEAIRALLNDPVQDVRKAAWIALRNLNDKGGELRRVPGVKAADGTRSWSVEAPEQSSDNDNDWKARLRSMMDK